MIRLIVLNFAGACALAWAWWLGYVQFVYTNDVSRISYVITAVFLLGMVQVFRGKTKHLERFEIWLVTLGLIGNVVGMILALQGIDATALGEAADVQKAGFEMLVGIAVALLSTLTGAVCAIWISVNAWALDK